MGSSREIDHADGAADAIARDGFALLPDVLDADSIRELRGALDAMPIAATKHRGRAVYGVRNLLASCPAIAELAQSNPIRGIVRAVLGPEAFATRAILFDKLPDADWAVRWHRDLVIAVSEQLDMPGFEGWSRKSGVWHVRPPTEIMARMLAVRVHLDDSDRENGCLRVLPGSHRPDFGDRADVNEGEAVDCLTKAGDVLLMRPLILHTSTTGTRPSRRRVVHMEFAGEELPAALDWHERV